ncbi:MAG TPA: hypothetical protein VK484_11775, partial [Ferruginibacter sp.]|nr:hypothetical protein [Ferruginibacter sp.]
MKQLITGLIIAINLTAVAQSPALTINVLMDPQKVGPDQYSIEMKICEPGNRTKSQDAFSHDTSAIDFSLLKAKEISCGQYSDKGIPELISGDEEPIPPNSYQFSNQV